MVSRWRADFMVGHWYVMRVDGNGMYEKRHPIPFDSEREAQRAADRLNARDASES